MRRLLLAGVAGLALVAGAERQAQAQTRPVYMTNGRPSVGSKDPPSLSQTGDFFASKADFSGVLGLVPDTYIQPADAGDDALAVQRAINAACAGASRRMHLLGRHYSMRSPVVQTCLLSWDGQGWQEQLADANGAAGMTGTWLDFTAGAFGSDGGANPVTIKDAHAAGSVLQGFGVTQPVTLPAAADTTWTPPSTPFLLAAENINGGIEFRDIMCRGVDKCLSAHIAGRTIFRNIRGQAWRVLIKIDKSFDASRVDEVHFWPYATTDQRVMNFTQTNAVALLSERDDTPMIGRMFVFGVNVGVALGNSATEGQYIPGGTTTGATIEVLSCDFTRHCLLGNSDASGVQIQIGQMRTYGQAWSADAQVASRTGMLASSDAIYIAGAGGTVQVGNLENFGTDDTTIRLDNAGAGNVQIGSAHLISTRMSANAVIAKMSGGVHTVTIGMAPMITPDVPSGWANTNAGSSGALYWPTPQKQN